MVSCVSAISGNPAPAAISPSPATCPALVTFKSDISSACHGYSPAALACMPNANETLMYPSAIGSPCRSPLR